MHFIFKNTVIFSCLYVCIVLLDIIVKLNFATFPYRFVSKPLIMMSLLVFYIVNQKEKSKKKYNYMLIALIAYSIGNVLLIIFNPRVVYIIGVLLFVVGKVFYVFRFTNERDFNIRRLVPFITFCFFYMAGIMYLVIKNLKELFLPTLIYLFSTILVGLFALLRKNEVSVKSYYYVLLGVAIAFICDSISILQIFYSSKILYPRITIILFYSISQYLIVRGVVEETKN